MTPLDAARAALEAAAKVCERDKIISGSLGPLMNVGYDMACKAHAAAIRAIDPAEVVKS